MIVTTTSDVQGRPIVEYHGLVTGEAILGANVVRDFFASIRDVVGGRSGAYEKVLESSPRLGHRGDGGGGQGARRRCRGRRRSRLRGAGQGGQHADGGRKRHRGEARLSPAAQVCVFRSPCVRERIGRTAWASRCGPAEGSEMATALPSLHHDLRVIGIVGAAHGGSHFFHLVLPPLFPLLKLAFGVGYTELGLLMSVFFATSGLPDAGRLPGRPDRRGPRPGGGAGPAGRPAACWRAWRRPISRCCRRRC